ncbi:hypothetical protein [Coleofasciculus sp. FACHB-1120]|uniref:hypothetical protein n=1 Tax=Coleofasciculus sp. FACHB-1120 TaxID=2692783 RepID=UPI001688EABF|nr:hypothetical protein [Coleofasciculus sp. FACHB-1120]MBD2741804.1 hypothetical protein [Coleofasciculus sp. FACHB-1120]
MYKILLTSLVAAGFILGAAARLQPASAGTCAAKCPPAPLQFVPGQRITYEVVNLTSSLVQMQKVVGTDPIPLNPGQVVSFVRGGGTDPNLSLLLWDATGLPLGMRLSKPNARTLRIEVRPGGRPPGDRTIYLRDDGRVAVY